jgi:hypothetical protein
MLFAENLIPDHFIIWISLTYLVSRRSASVYPHTFATRRNQFPLKHTDSTSQLQPGDLLWYAEIFSLFISNTFYMGEFLHDELKVLVLMAFIWQMQTTS